MTYSSACHAHLSNPSIMVIEDKEIVECLHCNNRLTRYNTTHFSIFLCPRCDGPNYQGKFTTSASKHSFEKTVLDFQVRKGKTPPPGLQNLDYDPKPYHTPQPCYDKNFSSTAQRTQSNVKNIPKSSSGQNHDQLVPTKSSTEELAMWIEKLVEERIRKATEKFQNKQDGQQKQIEELVREIKMLQIAQLSKSDSSSQEELNLGDQEVLPGGGGVDSAQFTPEWLEEYNKLSSSDSGAAANFSLRYDVKEIAQTEESLNRHRTGQQENIYFEANSSTGSYWLISYSPPAQPITINYIVPNKEKFRFRASALTAIQTYFDFKFAETKHSQSFSLEEVDVTRFKVIQPAEVLKIENSQEWQLQQKGVLAFPVREQEKSQPN